MKISNQDKMLLLEQEFLTLMFIVIMGFVFNEFKASLYFYLIVLAAGFILYFWMVHEEEIHLVGKKHIYFEHTSSYIMIAQTALALELLALNFNSGFLVFICMLISVIMYSISLSRILMFKMVFKNKHKRSIVE